MRGVPSPLAARLFFAFVCGVAVHGCTDSRPAPASPLDAQPSFAKATASVTVKATDPAFGDQGQTNQTVTITGSGFKSGAQAAWLRNGVVDPTITVSSTQVVSSTTAVAVISIAPNSPLDFRDVQVTNFDRTQGIGAAVFEVTQAHVISGTFAARGVNDNGEVTGSLTNGGVFYYNSSTGQLQTVSSSTTATGFEISPLGNAIAGGSINGSASPAYLYTRSGPIGSAWTATPLPLDPKATAGTADAMVTDPTTGRVTLLGGIEAFPSSHGCAVSSPVIWSWDASSNTWQRHPLPTNGSCTAAIRPRGLSANGTAVGSVGSVAAVWTPDGTGGYTLTLLDGSYANGIDGAASMIVGEKPVTRSSSTAVYWLPSASGWGSATPFAGGCTSSRDIADASGRITMNNCPFGGNSLLYAAFMDSPYTTPMKLGGVGGHNNNFIGGISPGGAYMVGYGYTTGGVQVGVYWQP